MLRIIVITLVVANLLLIAFQGSKPQDQPKTVTSQAGSEDTSIPTIHLFGELAQDEDLMTGTDHDGTFTRVISHR